MVQRTISPTLHLLCGLVSLGLSVVAADFYVATNGNDSWSGTLAAPNPARSDGPFMTLEWARDALRRAKAERPLAAGGTVWIRGGTYPRERSFELAAADSGAPQAPIVYRAYTNETPRLLGGAFRGNSIRHNFIHHTGGVGMGSMGVYMDDCVSGAEIYGNIFYQVTRAAFLGGGRDHRVENNIFVDCHPAVQIDGRGLDPAPVWHNMIFDYMKKQLDAVPQLLYRRRYPAIAALDAYYAGGKGVPPEGNVVRRNIAFGGEWLSVQWHAERQGLHLINNLVGVDPGFLAPEKMDFHLKPGSPAEGIGFEPIPVERIGLQRDPWRASLPSSSQ